ncbi:putative C6 transcription factor [Aspergillus floccosus]
MPQGGGENPSKRSCLRCHERKVRCDRKHPCGRRFQAKIKCSYPENKRAPRKLKRPQIATILGQLRQLEQGVGQLRVLSDTKDENSTCHEQLYRGASKQTQIQGSTSSPVNNHQSLNGASCVDNISESATDDLPLQSLGVLGSDSRSTAEASHSQLLQPSQIQALWGIYKENVAPMIALLHKRSIETIIQEACIQAKPTVGVALEALILAVCFAATVSATPAQCRSIIAQGRDSCIRVSRRAVEKALARANLISTKDIQVLQASVLFLLWVHRDGQFSGLSPFDIEVRRRLWWHICILDMLCSEDQGTDTQIRPEMFSTKPPSKVDADDLAPDLTTLLPSRSGSTDITLCIIQCEVMLNLYWGSINLNPETTQSPMPTRDNIMCSLATRIEEQYLLDFDLNIPIQWLTAVIARLSLSKARVVSLLSSARPGEVPVATTDEVVNMAIEIVKFANLIQKNEATSQWAWICKSYKQTHAVAFILSEICVRPISPETNQAWDVASDMYHQWQQEDDKTHPMLQNSLSRLMEQATIS